MDLLEDLSLVLDRLTESDDFSYSDPDSIMVLQRASARLSAALSHKVAAFAAGGEWSSEGAQSAAAWISTRCHVPLREARAQVRRGAALVSMPVVATAFGQGVIGPAQVDLLVKAQREVVQAAAQDAATVSTRSSSPSVRPTWSTRPLSSVSGPFVTW